MVVMSFLIGVNSDSALFEVCSISINNLRYEGKKMHRLWVRFI